MSKLVFEIYSSNSRSRLLFFLLIALLGGASVSKSIGIFSHKIREIELAIGGAIYLHMVGAFTLGALAFLSSSRQTTFGISRNSFIVLCLIVLDESLQFHFPNRQFSWLDMTVNVCAVLSGNYFVWLISKVRPCN
ncbi:hypothetical protein [uncultured Vibrio sp.]|uniref:hypothetical protein n=1 Tax=uncultured Vibrio sp. TaxID=114054 RepID=UPI0025E2CE0C|nr:hypothetical protein [uncultured Vibrio sp.]